MDRKKYMVIYGLWERKNPNKYGREREEEELVKKSYESYKMTHKM